MNKKNSDLKNNTEIINLSVPEDLSRARKVLEVETTGLKGLSKSLDRTFIEVIDMLQTIKGRVVVSGMGKSGHVARKISSTLASTGIPSFFVHPGEASHGDLGMIDNDDAVIAISEHIAGHIRRVYGVTDDRVRVVYRGIDTDLFEPSGVNSERVIALAQQWRLTEPIPVVMMSGRLTRWKGQQVLIEALAILNRHDIRCLFIGDDQGRHGYRRQLDALVKKLDLSNITAV